MHKLRGDTLIEVMFSVGIFGMVAVGAISLMNRGLYTAQGTLETTMARNEIDTQAEALRFIHDAYSSKKHSTSNVYKSLWEIIEDRAVEYDDSKFAKFLAAYEAVAAGGGEIDGVTYNSCADLYSSANNIIPEKSFAVNPSILDEATLQEMLDNGHLQDVILYYSPNSTSYLSPTMTFPRLFYGDSALSDADSGIVNDRTLNSAQGIIVTAVKSASYEEVGCDDEVKEREADFYDFYIHTCWESPGGDSSRTISTTVRLYNSDQISLNQNRQITFANYEWKTYGDRVYRSCSGVVCAQSQDPNPVKRSYAYGDRTYTYYDTSCEPNAGQHVTFPNETSIRLIGSTADAVSLGAYYDKFETNSRFSLSLHVDASNIGAHPSESGGFTIGFDIVDAEGKTLVDGVAVSIGSNSRTITGLNSNVTIGTPDFDLAMTYNRGDFTVCITETGRTEQCFTTTKDIPAGSYLKVDYKLTHGAHCCSNNAVVYISDIQMLQTGGSGSALASKCGDNYDIVYNKNDGSPSTWVDNNPVVGRSTVIASADTFSWGGHVFREWTENADGSGNSYSPGQSVNFNASKGSRVYLYAQWDTVGVISYEANGGSGDMPAQSTDVSGNAIVGSNAFFAPSSNHRFVGWNTEADGSGTSYQPGNAINTLGSITLYAQWEEILHDYTITYHGNGDTDAEGNILNSTRSTVKQENSSYTIEGAGSFYREAYKVASWNTSANGSGTTYNIGQQITVSGNLDLYAVWKVNDADSGHQTVEMLGTDKLFNTLLLAPRFVSNSYPSLYTGSSTVDFEPMVWYAGYDNGYYACENPPCSANAWSAVGFHLPTDASGGTAVIYLRLAEGHRVNAQTKGSFVYYYSNEFTVDQASSATMSNTDRGMGFPQLHLYSTQHNSYKISDHQKAHKISGADASASLIPSYWIIGKLTWTSSGLQLTPINRFTSDTPDNFL
ncbi:InlB B-repeat-containing protein [Candidatus Saccharibacteria bacterium]|nr:InlB B-repeat-containing protein [Candidatus Saccharibacteria bacterium]